MLNRFVPHTAYIHIITALAGFCQLLPVTARAEYRLNLQQPVTEVARQQYDLHTAILVITAIIGLGVFAVMFYSIVKHRKSAGHQAAQFHENTAVEIAWTIIPFFIIMAMALPATVVVLNYRDASNPDLTIKVVGTQWKWSYDYLDEGVFFYSTISTPPEQIGPLYYGGEGVPSEAAGENYLLEVDNPMVVPVDTKVRLLLTAGDVIHSWWVPQLGVKQDAVPGLVRSSWFEATETGTYRGQCAELCGKNHAFMPVVVEVVSPEEYRDWVAGMRSAAAEPAAEDSPQLVGTVAQAQAPAPAEAAEPREWSAEDLMEQGQLSYTSMCSACHQADGSGLPPTFPALAGAEIASGPAPAHIDIVLDGKDGTTMAAFSHLSDAQLAAIITYERQSWGNSGSIVMPADVAARR